MSDDRKPETPGEKAPPAKGDTETGIGQVQSGLTHPPTTRNERLWAASGYFASLAAIWIIVPAVALAVRGRDSRFVRFHAVQAVLFQVASVPFIIIGTGVSTALSIWITIATSDKRGHAPMAQIVSSVSNAIVFTVPLAIALWLGLGAMRGEPRALPLLGRLARRITKDMHPE